MRPAANSTASSVNLIAELASYPQISQTRQIYSLHLDRAGHFPISKTHWEIFPKPSPATAATMSVLLEVSTVFWPVKLAWSRGRNSSPCKNRWRDLEDPSGPKC